MKNKGFVLFLVILLAVVCLYQLSFTLVTRNVEKGVRAEVMAIVGSDTSAEYAKLYKRHIDSIQAKKVYPVFGYSYQECKKREINLGLDLQGGMNVTLEISTPDMVRELADEQDPQFKKAMEAAEAAYLGQGSFVDYFAAEYEKISPEKGLAPIFYTTNRKSDLPNQYASTNQEIYDWLKREEKALVGETFKVISTRIDQFNVTQPNVQQLDNGRILVELPGVDNPERVIDLLQNSAKLEFWEVYNNQQVYEYLNKAEKILSNRLKEKMEEEGLLGDDSTGSKEENLLGAGMDFDEGLETMEDAQADTSGVNDTANLVTEEPVAANDTAKLDTGALVANDTNKQLTPEEQMIENPYYSRINPPQENGKLIIANFVGTIANKDVEFFDSNMIHDEEVMTEFPENLRFRWGKDLGGYRRLYALKAVNGKAILDGDVIDNARPTIAPNGQYEVTMFMNSAAAKEWKRITEAASSQNPKGAVAIVLDNQVYSAPVVQGPIPNGVSSITGGFNSEEAGDLSNILKAGRLEVATNIVEQTVVGPTLGQKAINAGLISLLVGFLAVIGFMIFYYGRAGIYAVIALLANLFFILGVLSGYGAALTLPGMAGLVLTIGMAVDANVLIFERVKEELASGKGFKAAIKQGYRAALTSIVDANVTTLIAAIILMTLGKGPVAGFGIILLIGILSSLFTSILLTRLFVERDIKQGREIAFNTAPSKNMLSNFNFNFIGNRKKFYLVSGVIIAVGLVSMFTKKLSTGVDFKGGWSYVVDVEGANNSDDIKLELQDRIPDNVEVKSYGTEGWYKITTSYRINDNDTAVSEEVKDTIIGSLAKFDVTKAQIMSESKVGPTIAEDIKVNSTWAIILSLIGMFIYIVARFRKWGYGLGATVALFHDVLIVFSIYSIFDGILPFSMDIDQAFIAAILTVVGYSINDTVVVFDRVREFLGLHKFEKDTAMVINNAINQTLSRTLVTSLTTLLVIVILFAFGGEGLKGFTFALLVGVGVGTYSSICIATPIVVDFLPKKKQ